MSNLFKKRYLRKPLVTAAAITAVVAAGPIAWQLTAATATTSTLAGSNFESGDGNQDVQTSGNVDWGTASASGVHYLDTVDPPNPLASLPDNSFGQGAKEDIPNPNIVTGSIPPNKSDLTDFYTAYKTETPDSTKTSNTFTANHTFLYLGWKRTKNLGNANMDFEFNQNAGQTYVNPSTGGTPTRTAGDILVTFDFPGSGSPVLSLFRWLTAGNGDSKSSCFSASALPCWGNGSLGDLGSTANGAVSSDGTFGEAGLDLTAANVFSASSCTTFGDAFMKSRSSSSFTSEIKDYIQLAPGSISVSNCGGLKIHKTDDATPANALSGVGFTLYNPNATNTGTGTSAGFTCTTDSNGNCTFIDTNSKTGIPFGDYWISETTPKSGYTPVDDFLVHVTATSADSAIQLQDLRQLADISFTKKDDNNTALKNAVFTLYNDVSSTTSDGFPTGTPPTGYNDAANVTTFTCTTSAAGLCSISGVGAGKYWIVETGSPSGYTKVAPYRLTVVLGGGPYNLTTAFQDPRKFNVITIVCVQNTQTDLNATATQGLYGSKVAYGSDPLPSSNNSLTTVPGAISESANALCSALGASGANLTGVPKGDYTSKIQIP